MSTKLTTIDKEILKTAIEVAKSAADKGNYPVGAVLTVNGEIIVAQVMILINANLLLATPRFLSLSAMARSYIKPGKKIR